jgi:hypothetical protein
MRKLVTRYTCDAPDCEDTVDLEGTPDTPSVQHTAMAPLPDGWIEFSVTGSSPGGEQQLVHASKPECAAKLAESQVGAAVQAAEQKQVEEDEQRQKAEEAVEGAQENEETGDEAEES